MYLKLRLVALHVLYTYIVEEVCAYGFQSLYR